jgi:hypothetical protein
MFVSAESLPFNMAELIEQLAQSNGSLVKISAFPKAICLIRAKWKQL